MTQKEALNILKMGHNVYITGAAGSGKTHLLNQYIDYLKDHEVDIGVTASTGIAATHMGGVTIHSWTGLGVKDVVTEYDLEALEEKQYLWKRMEKVKVLIIDEVSMLHHFRLDLVDRVLKMFKRSNDPFGGIQVVLCGDFFQLPPVSRYGQPESKFIYHSQAWKESDLRICYLEEQHRQKDNVSTKVLNAIRANAVDNGVMDHIKQCFKQEKIKATGPFVEPTRLYTHNIDVDKVNDDALKTLKSAEEVYEMHTKGNETLVDILKKSCLAPEFLRLRVGAKVMFVKNNFEMDYANGTLGIVKKLHGTAGGPVVEMRNGKVIEVPVESWTIEEDGKVKAELQQYPLRLAWAITIHKSQGMSLDAVEVDLSRSFEKGMGYVALSRVRSFDGLTILGLNETALHVHPEVLIFDKQLREKSKDARGRLLELSEGGRTAQAKEAFIKSIAPEWVFSAVDVVGEDGKIKKVKVKGSRPKKPSTFEKTLTFIQEKIQLKEIADHRGMTEETVLSHIEKLLESGHVTKKDIEYMQKKVSPKKYSDIETAFRESSRKTGDWSLSPVKNMLGSNVSYRDIRLVRLFVKK